MGREKGVLMGNDYRMGFHIMARRGWVNDPNGLCQWRGTYHVYHQLRPSWPADGECCWGHLTSDDLCHWEVHDVAIHADTPDDASGAYSGCAVIDGETMRLYYTGNVREPGDHDYITSGRQANQILVESPDGFAMGEKRVLLRNADYPDFCSCHVRDPYVWREDDSRGGYHMVLGARDLDSRGLALLYDSADGYDWHLRQVVRSHETFGYMWECPNRIALPCAVGAVDDGTTSDGAVREFLAFCPQGLPSEELRWHNRDQSGYVPLDGRMLDVREVDERRFREFDHGFDFYAPQVFVDERGRTLLMGWLGTFKPPYECAPGGIAFCHCLTVPRVLALDETGERILQNPAPELEALRLGELTRGADGSFACDRHRADVVLGGIDASGLEMTLDGGDLSVRVGDGIATVSFGDPADVGAGRTSRSFEVGVVRSLRALIDDSAVELFFDGGRTCFATRWFPTASHLTVRVDARGACGVARAWAMGDGLAGTF